MRLLNSNNVDMCLARAKTIKKDHLYVKRKNSATYVTDKPLHLLWTISTCMYLYLVASDLKDCFFAHNLKTGRHFKWFTKKISGSKSWHAILVHDNRLSYLEKVTSMSDVSFFSLSPRSRLCFFPHPCTIAQKHRQKQMLLSSLHHVTQALTEKFSVPKQCSTLTVLLHITNQNKCRLERERNCFSGSAAICHAIHLTRFHPI
jgi:hypothetical protein